LCFLGFFLQLEPPHMSIFKVNGITLPLRVLFEPSRVPFDWKFYLAAKRVYRKYKQSLLFVVPANGGLGGGLKSAIAGGMKIL
jgi:hypothetical protein